MATVARRIICYGGIEILVRFFRKILGSIYRAVYFLASSLKLIPIFKKRMVYQYLESSVVDYNGYKFFVFDRLDEKAKSYKRLATAGNVEMKLFKQYSPQVDTIIDIGANYGEFLVWVGDGFSGKYYAFEPNILPFAGLMKTVSYNRFPFHVVPINAAVDDSHGFAEFHTNIWSSGASSLLEGRSRRSTIYGAFGSLRTTVIKTSISEAIDRYGIQGKMFVKIDTEGTDISILLSLIQESGLDICFLIFEASEEQFRELSESQTQALLNFASAYRVKAIYQNQIHDIEFTVENIFKAFEAATNQIDFFFSKRDAS